VEELLLSLLNTHRVSDIRLIEIHVAEPLVPKPSLLEVEIATAKLKRYKLPDSNQIQAELTQTGGETYSLKSISSLILFGIRKNCLITEGVSYFTSSQER
jgi:hypothetical protein